jgi:hypothetical protein
VEFFVMVGLQAIRFPDMTDGVGRGRPHERFMAVQNVRARLAYNWGDHKRGSYKLSDAIRETAEQEVLHCKRVAAAWRGEDPDLVILDQDDGDDLRRSGKRIETAYYAYFLSDPVPMTSV